MFKYHSDMGQCFSQVVVVKKYIYFYFTFLNLGKTDMVLEKKVAIFYWEWGRNSAPRHAREGQKIPWKHYGLRRVHVTI